MSLQQSLTVDAAVGVFSESEEAAAALRAPVEGDAAVMARIARGDADAFAALVEAHSGRLYRLAYRMLCDAQEAEDAVQDSFTRLWQGAAKWTPRGGGLAAWLYRVTLNGCLDRLRRYRVVADDDAVLAAEDERPGPERQLAVRRLQNAIEYALHALPHRHRAALVLCYLEGFSNASAAEMLSLNLKAMESLLFRARRGLREELENRGVAAEDMELLA